MIFTTRDASSKSEGAIVKVRLRRLSFGRPSSIDSPCKVNSTRRKMPNVFFVVGLDIAKMVVRIFELRWIRRYGVLGAIMAR